MKFIKLLLQHTWWNSTFSSQKAIHEILKFYLFNINNFLAFDSWNWIWCFLCYSFNTWFFKFAFDYNIPMVMLKMENNFSHHENYRFEIVQIFQSIGTSKWNDIDVF
jgi:hypothetical protein